MALKDWSLTAADNDDADGDISINGTTSSIRLGDNAIRAIMQKVAIWNADTNGSRSTAGSSNTYTYASAGSAGTPADGFAAYATGDSLYVQPNHTNTGAATLNVDSVGAKAVRKYVNGSEVAIAAGDLLSGAPAHLIYDADANSAAGAWILQNPLAFLVTIETGSFPSANSHDISSIPQTYSRLLLIISDVSFDTSTRQLLVRVNTDNSGYGGHVIVGGTNVAATSYAATFANQAAGETASMAIEFTGYQSGPFTKVTSSGLSRSGGTASTTSGDVTRLSGTAMTSIRMLLDSTGNFDGGTYTLYGYR